MPASASPPASATSAPLPPTTHGPWELTRRMQVLMVALAVGCLLSRAWLLQLPWLALVPLLPAAILAARRGRRAPPVVALLSLSSAGQLVMVALTGGLRSPMLVVPGAMGLVYGFLLGHTPHWRRIRWLIPAGLLLLALAAQLLPLAPLVEPLEPTAQAFWWAGFSLAMVSGMHVLGAQLGAALRTQQIALRESTAAAEREVANRMADRNQALLEFTRAVSHELKNPLGAVTALSTLLEGRARRAASRDAESLRVLVGEVRRMGAILEELRSSALPAAAHTMGEAELAPLLRDLLTAHQGLAVDHEVALVLTDSAPVRVAMQPDRLRQVLTNLLQNALEVAPTGSRVELQSEAIEGGRVRIEVRDEGAGIAPSMRGRLFVKGASSKAAGSGLGLHISRMLVESVGGALSLVERDRGGCVAWVELPLA